MHSSLRSPLVPVAFTAGLTPCPPARPELVAGAPAARARLAAAIERTGAGRKGG